MLNKLDLESAREQLQHDLDCILDGIDCDMSIVCQAVVDTFAPLIEKLENVNA